MWDTWVPSLDWEDPWRKTWQRTPIFLPGNSPRTEEPGGLQLMGSQRVGQDWATKHNTYVQLAGTNLCKIIQRRHASFARRTGSLFYGRGCGTIEKGQSLGQMWVVFTKVVSWERRSQTNASDYCSFTGKNILKVNMDPENYSQWISSVSSLLSMTWVSLL